MTYKVRREGASQKIIVDSLEDARTAARNWAAEGSRPESSTAWAHAILVATEDDGKQNTYGITATIDPKEPECLDGEDHDWQSPIRLVGGIEANPGVFGHGGGVIISQVCMRCGCGKLTDTWARDPGTRRQGLTSVTYEKGKYAHQIEQEVESKRGGFRDRWAEEQRRKDQSNRLAVAIRETYVFRMPFIAEADGRA